MNKFILSLLLIFGFSANSAQSLSVKNAEIGDFLALKNDLIFPENATDVRLSVGDIGCVTRRKEAGINCAGYKLSKVKRNTYRAIHYLQKDQHVVGFQFNVEKGGCIYDLGVWCGGSTKNETNQIYEALDQIVSIKKDDRVAPEWP